ncbi:MoaD/ThiS family protein [Egibacter rhizosphaerae]|uniref:MoaD/ThiS family protein n=1 Tax=Egibacter rhizosphaerae TaxID=1670831 RepID=A0A411YFB4_9ACTN|nr:MoaD/ThiS family protein [Egibacter rhizosphaerae]QBI19797.1 MoaD/ThiS family protein [Egibacter rhizosphaerae]
MPVTVRLPGVLQPAVGRVREVEVEASTVGDAIASLLARHPELRPHLFDEGGALRTHVLCVVDGEPTRLRQPDQPLRAGSEIAFVPAVSGG